MISSSQFQEMYGRKPDASDIEAMDDSPDFFEISYRDFSNRNIEEEITNQVIEARFANDKY